MAREAGVSGTLLDYLLTKALRVALRIHQQMPASGSRVSLADIVVEYLLDRLHRTPGQVALIGVSPMTRRCGLLLAGKGQSALVVNRTPEVAADLALELGGEPRSLDEFRARPDAVEALVIATGSPEVLLGRPELERTRRPVRRVGSRHWSSTCPVPPNVDRNAARVVGVTLVEMDGIVEEARADRDRRLAELAPAREFVDESLAKLRKDLAERLMSPVIARLNRRYRQTAREGVERLFRKELKGVDEAGRDAIYRWAQVMARRFAHIPVKGLRKLAAEFGAPAVRTFLLASGEELFPEGSQVFDQLEELTEREGLV